MDGYAQLICPSESASSVELVCDNSHAAGENMYECDANWMVRASRDSDSDDSDATQRHTSFQQPTLHDTDTGYSVDIE